jgi:hypothetical protein
MGFPFILISDIGLGISPGIVSCIGRYDLRLNWYELNVFVLLLGKSWVESGVISLLVDNPVEVIGRSDVGLLGPLDFVRLVVLAIGESVVSLGVWGDVGVAVLDWIDGLILLLLTHPN